MGASCGMCGAPLALDPGGSRFAHVELMEFDVVPETEELTPRCCDGTPEILVSDALCGSCSEGLREIVSKYYRRKEKSGDGRVDDGADTGEEPDQVRGA
jgi:hypothetical protein